MLSDIEVLTLFGDPPYGDIACVCEWLYVSVCVWEGDANKKNLHLANHNYVRLPVRLLN